jgi:hypothetical protein
MNSTRLLIPALVTVLLAGCASPVPREDLGDLEHFELLKQMQWMDPARGGEGFDYGPGGRAGYADAVREEIIRRHPEWSAERIALIRAQQVEIGMSHGQVVASIGWPFEYPGLLWAYRPGTGRHHASDPAIIAERGRANRWTYGTGSDNFHVWFREGRVWHIIDNRVDGSADGA